MTHPIENMPMTRGNFVDALVVDKDQAQADLAAAQKATTDLIAERDKLISELADANRFKSRFSDLFSDQIELAVKSAMLDYESDFDINAYESEIQEIARDGFDASDHSDDIANAVGFDIYDHKSDVADIVRDVLRDATVKLEV